MDIKGKEKERDAKLNGKLIELLDVEVRDKF